MNFKKEFKNILIVRTDRIGDVVLTTPVIKSLREAYPASRICILINPLTQDLLKGNPYLDEILIDDREHQHKGRGFFTLVNTLNQRKFDLAIIFHTKRRTNLLCFLAGIRRRAGYKNNKFGFLLTDPIKDVRHLGEKHEAQYCLDVLKHLGVKAGPLELFVPIQEEAIVWLKEFEQNNGLQPSDRLVIIHPGASDPSKRWPEGRFAEIIDSLTKRYAVKIILIGASHIQEVSEKILSLVNSPVIDLTGKTTVAQMAVLLKRSCLLVSNDSGPVHIASALGCPVVSIFTRNQPGINPGRWRPLSPQSRTVAVLPEQNYHFTFKKGGPIGGQYLELISAQTVLEAVDGLCKLC